MNPEIFSAIEHIRRVASAPRITSGDVAVVFETINKYFGDFKRSQNLGVQISCYRPGFASFWSFLAQSRG